MPSSARLCFVAAAACSALSWAEPSVEADAGTEAEAADESVTSQVASFAVTKLKDSPAVVTIISAQDLREAGVRDLADALMLVPGVFLGLDTQGIVGAGFRGLWGHEGKILLMVDGKEMNDLLYSTSQFGNEFPVELIERVEVVRGPGSVIYGGNAELAVINVVTRGVQGGTDLQVSGTYGQFTEGPSFLESYARRSASISGRYVFDAVPGLSAFASASIGQGQRSTRDFTDFDGATGSLAGRSALDPAVVQAGIGFRDVQATFLFHRYGTNSISGTGAVLSAPADAVFESYHADVTGTFRPTNRLEIIPRVNLTIQRPWTEKNQDSDLFYDKSARRIRARLIGRWAPIDELQVTAGADAMFDHGQLNAPAGPGLQTTFGDATSIDYRTFAGFLELFSENPVVNVAAGARYDNNSAVGGALVPRVVLLRGFGPVKFKGLFSLAFRWPGIENLNLGTDLRAERTTVFEFEGAVELPSKIRFAANVFNIGIDAPIAYTIDSVTGAEGYLNLGKQGTSGGEASFSIRGGWGRAEASYSLYVPTLGVGIPNYLAPGRVDMFLGAPAHRASLVGVVKPIEWLSLAPVVHLYGPRLSIGPSDMNGNVTTVQIPTQVMANFVVRVENVPVKGLSASLGVYNLFGTDYRFVQPYTGGHAPLPGLGREVMLKLTYLFEPTYE